MSIREEIIKQAEKAKKASYQLANIYTNDKNRALYMVAEGLESNVELILKENEKDLKKAKEQNMSKAFIDRLSLSRKRIEQMANGVREVADLDDPVGDIIEMKNRPNGLKIGKMRVPIGVIGIIYEARPNVTVDAAVLCLKSGNSVILRG